MFCCEGFTADGALLYELGRPSYIDEAIEKIVDICELRKISNSKILELGAGTGKFTTSFNSFISKTGLRQRISYIATEPSDGFLKSNEELNISKFGSQYLSFKKGTGSSIPEESKTLDCVIAAQAFHWMANESTLIEVNRVLKPRAPIILLWNTYDYEANKWMKQIDDEILSPAYRLAGAPRQQDRTWQQCFQTSKAVNLFDSPLDFWYARHTHKLTREGILARILSTSVIFEQSPEEQSRTREHLASILNEHRDLESSRKTGIFNLDYVVEVAWTRSKI